MYSFDRDEYERRMKWFLEARFGMFIHWGLYAIPARGEWVRQYGANGRSRLYALFLRI